MFQMRLQALEHPNPSSVNAEDRKVFAKTVLWLEDQVIRLYTVEDRAGLRNVENLKDWEKAYQRYTKDLCLPKFHTTSEDLFWLLSYGVRLVFLDSPETFEDISSCGVEKQENILDGKESVEQQDDVLLDKKESITYLADSEEEDIINSGMKYAMKKAAQEKAISRRSLLNAKGRPKRKRPLTDSERKLLYPGWGKPGGPGDPRRIGLRRAGLKWFLRFIAEGYSSKEARKMVDERRKRKKCKLPEEILHKIIQPQDQRSFEIETPDLLERQNRSHSPQNIPTKKIKMTTLDKADYPLPDPFKQGLSRAGKKWYMRFIESGIEPSVARQMVEQRRSQ